MKDNNKTNYTNVTLNSTSSSIKAEPYTFSASAVIQSLFKFNKLVNGETCQGLRHWRLLFNLKNNFSKPVRNDMKDKIPKQVRNDEVTCAPLAGEPKSLISKGGKNRLDCFAFARNDEIVGFEDNKILNQLTATPTHTDSHVSP